MKLSGFTAARTLYKFLYIMQGEYLEGLQGGFIDAPLCN